VDQKTVSKRVSILGREGMGQANVLGREGKGGGEGVGEGLRGGGDVVRRKRKREGEDGSDGEEQAEQAIVGAEAQAQAAEVEAEAQAQAEAETKAEAMQLLPTVRSFHAEVRCSMRCSGGGCGHEWSRTEFYRDFSLDITAGGVKRQQQEQQQQEQQQEAKRGQQQQQQQEAKRGQQQRPHCQSKNQRDTDGGVLMWCSSCKGSNKQPANVKAGFESCCRECAVGRKCTCPPRTSSSSSSSSSTSSSSTSSTSGGEVSIQQLLDQFFAPHPLQVQCVYTLTIDSL
jgi:hypothetical protein